MKMNWGLINGRTINQPTGSQQTAVVSEVLQFPLVYPSLNAYFEDSLAEALDFTTAHAWTDNYHIQERLEVTTSEAPSGESQVVLAEDMKFHEFLRFGLVSQLTESLDLTDLAQIHYVAVAIAQEILGLQPTLNADAVMTVTLQYTASLNDQQLYGFGGSVSENLDLVEALIEEIESLIAISENLELAELLGAPQLWIYTPATQEALSLTDDQLNIATIYDLIGDNLTFGIRFTDGTDSYAGWALNTKRLGASNYTNFNFNSFHRVGNVVYGGSSTGIYKLTGTDDDGTKINPVVTTALMNLQNGRQVRTPNIYLGVLTDAKILVKTVTSEGKERWYESGHPQSTHMDTMRVALGRRQGSRLWQYQVSRREGDEFELSRIEVLPVILTRRVPNGK